MSFFFGNFPHTPKLIKFCTRMGSGENVSILGVPNMGMQNCPVWTYPRFVHLFMQTTNSHKKKVSMTNIQEVYHFELNLWLLARFLWFEGLLSEQSLSQRSDWIDLIFGVSNLHPCLALNCKAFKFLSKGNPPMGSQWILTFCHENSTL